MFRINTIWRICLLTIFISSVSLQLQSAEKNPLLYKKSDIADARFGDAEKAQMLSKAYDIADEVNRVIFGQEDAAAILQDRVIQFLEAHPHRKGEPAALNMIGLPGIGKTAMLVALKNLGFEVIFMNAQDYSGERTHFASDLMSRLAERGIIADEYDEAMPVTKPVILIVDELDKVPEMIDGKAERTLPIIGTLNSFLSEGVIHRPFSNDLDVSNILLITTMNFAPAEIENFSKEALGENKSFYDFTLDDYQKFDQWVRTQPSARYKILSRMFRTNTVSRFAPNTVILQPLTEPVYRRIVELVVSESIAMLATNDKRISVEVDKSLVDFLVEQTVFAPSGARETVFRTKALVEQLINYGIKAEDPNDPQSVLRPRKIAIRFDQGHAVVKVTTQVMQKGKTLKDSTQFEFNTEYMPGARLFRQPSGLVASRPAIKTHQKAKSDEAPPKITKKEVLELRYPKTARIPRHVKENISRALIGQEAAIDVILDDLRKYLGRPGPAAKEPSFRVLSGFPGIGKSELVRLVGEQLELPVIKINMQQYASDSPEVVRLFVGQLQQSIREATEKSKTGKYILLFEELDKLFELDSMGNPISRPVMSVVKDLLNEGTFHASMKVGGGYDDEEVVKTTVDIRKAFTAITMNFSVDLFQFSADPRLTSIDDVMRAWKRISTTPMATKEILGSIFLPETVSRLMAKFLIMKPLTAEEYAQLIEIQTAHVIRSRLYDKSGRNVGQIQIKLSPAYKRYLYQETVIPSEGARHTVVSVQSKISSDIEMALANISKSSGFATAPIEITLDFSEAKSSVIAKAKIQGDKSSRPKQLAKRVVALQFPSPAVKGRVSAERMKTAAHEFGHAFVAARLGLRFEQVVVVSPKPGIGGYVKFSDKNQSARSLLANVYATLASRALERMVLSDDPLSDASVLDITSGPSSDIQHATMGLFNALYELGFDPQGGTVDRNFVQGMGKYADFASLPHELAEQLGLLLRAMENQIIEDLLQAHKQDWYVQKIVRLASAGAMNEAQFFELIEYPYPGEKLSSVSPEKFKKLFAKYIVADSKELLKSQNSRTKVQSQTVGENIEQYMQRFTELLRKHFHSPSAANKDQSCRSVLSESR